MMSDLATSAMTMAALLVAALDMSVPDAGAQCERPVDPPQTRPHAEDFLAFATSDPFLLPARLPDLEPSRPPLWQGQDGEMPDPSLCGI